jgi:hypothetical protein
MEMPEVLNPFRFALIALTFAKSFGRLRYHTRQVRLGMLQPAEILTILAKRSTSP